MVEEVICKLSQLLHFGFYQKVTQAHGSSKSNFLATLERLYLCLK